MEWIRICVGGDKYVVINPNAVKEVNITKTRIELILSDGKTHKYGTSAEGGATVVSANELKKLQEQFGINLGPS